MSDLVDVQQRRSPIVFADAAGTAVFVVTLAIGTAWREDRPAQVLVVVVSMLLFAIGAAACLWAYTTALERSRTEEVGVANLYLLTGSTVSKVAKRSMSGLLAVQVVVALAAASIGAAGLSGDTLNALAFGVLVPMFGLGMNGLLASRHGSFGPRVQAVPTSKRRID